MSKLFESYKTNKLTLRNRFVMSAAADNLDNNIKKRIERFSALARGGIGLIISGGIRVHQIEEWSEVTEVIHKNGGKIAAGIIAGYGYDIFEISQGLMNFDEKKLTERRCTPALMTYQKKDISEIGVKRLNLLLISQPSCLAVYGLMNLLVRL